jgi:hypothetical protein
MGDPAAAQPPIGYLDTLHGSTLADNKRHYIVRHELMRLLLACTQVCALFSEWESRTGLGAIVDEIRAAMAALEVVVASEQPQALAGPALDLELATPPVLQALERYQHAIARFNAASAASHRYVWDGADSFIVNLPGGQDLSWPWLRQDLVRAFMLRLHARLEDRRPRASELYRPVYLDAPSPRESFTFTPVPDESAAAAVARFDREADEYRARLARGILPDGWGADQDSEALKRYAAWVYESAVQDKSIRQIAIEAFPETKDRSHVRRGIARARALLALAGELTPVYADAAADGLPG